MTPSSLSSASSSALSGRARRRTASSRAGIIRWARPVETTWGGSSGWASEASRPSAAKTRPGSISSPKTAGSWSIEARATPLAPELDVDRLQAGHRLLDVVRLALARARRDGDRRAERRVPGEGQLAHDRPDAVAVVGARLGRGLDEGRLRELRLAREGEHRRVVDAVGVVDDGEAVAGQRPRREDVEPRQALGH